MMILAAIAAIAYLIIGCMTLKFITDEPKISLIVYAVTLVMVLALWPLLWLVMLFIHAIEFEISLPKWMRSK